MDSIITKEKIEELAGSLADVPLVVKGPYCAEPYMRFCYKAMQEFGFQSPVVIGTGYGTLTHHLAKGNPDVKVYSVDTSDTILRPEENLKNEVFFIKDDVYDLEGIPQSIDFLVLDIIKKETIEPDVIDSNNQPVRGTGKWKDVSKLEDLELVAKFLFARLQPGALVLVNDINDINGKTAFYESVQWDKLWLPELNTRGFCAFIVPSLT